LSLNGPITSLKTYQLTNSKQIAESFRRFGISPTTSSLLIIKVSTPTSPFTSVQVQEHLSKVIEGTQIPFSDDEIGQMTDLARVRKIYKFNAAGGGKKANVVNGVDGKSEEEERKELEVLVLGTMALRGATN
jgi:EKC/KEOPS complex subunit CGI121/TPRKB